MPALPHALNATEPMARVHHRQMRTCALRTREPLRRLGVDLLNLARNSAILAGFFHSVYLRASCKAAKLMRRRFFRSGFDACVP